MGSISLTLSKDKAEPIKLSLNKVERYIVELYWSSQQDVDVGAMLLDSQGKLTDINCLLSTYNTANVLQSDTSRKINRGSKHPFQNLGGYLLHNGDVTSGVSISGEQPQEVLEIVESLIPSFGHEIPILVSIHPPSSNTFASIKDARIVIKDDKGTIYLEASLTKDFDKFNIVSMGSLKRTSSGWEFNPQAKGFLGDLNDILAAVS